MSSATETEFKDGIPFLSSPLICFNFFLLGVLAPWPIYLLTVTECCSSSNTTSELKIKSCMDFDEDFQILSASPLSPPLYP